MKEVAISFPNAAVSRLFRSPCSQIWQMLTDTAIWPQWGPSLEAVECSDRFIRQGTEGKVKTAVGICVPFIITAYEEGRFWAWKVAGVPATGHRVESQEEGLCKLTFEVPLLAAPYGYICKIALDRIAGILDK